MKKLKEQLTHSITRPKHQEVLEQNQARHDTDINGLEKRLSEKESLWHKKIDDQRSEFEKERKRYQDEIDKLKKDLEVERNSNHIKV